MKNYKLKKYIFDKIYELNINIFIEDCYILYVSPLINLHLIIHDNSILLILKLLRSITSINSLNSFSIHRDIRILSLGKLLLINLVLSWHILSLGKLLLINLVLSWHILSLGKLLLINLVLSWHLNYLILCFIIFCFRLIL